MRPGYRWVYRCHGCGWTTTDYAEVVGHAGGHFITPHLEEVPDEPAG